MTAVGMDQDRARKLRDAMTDWLIRQGQISSPEMERAFRTVPRHAFAVTDTPLEDCYGRSVIRNKTDADGVSLSTVSAAWLQAAMINQSGIGPGAMVLEIGTTGYNAAVISEMAGPRGHVVTVDYDAEVAGWAEAALESTGYADRITVITGDGEHGAPGYGPFDAVIVTAGCWDIAPAWLEQLKPGGILVIPLRMNGVTRSLAFRREGDHLASVSSITCGFVPLGGLGAKPETVFNMDSPAGGRIVLRFEDDVPAQPPLPDSVLTEKPVEAWSGLTIPDETAWSDLYLWLSGFEPGFCRLDQDGEPRLAGGGPVMKTGWFPFAIAHDGTLSYITTRDLPGGGLEFGAYAYGSRADDAAAALVRHLRGWDARGRDLPGDAFAYWPSGTTPPPSDSLTSSWRKRRGLVTITWPAAGKDR